MPYRIQNAFAQGYDLYFFVRSGKIVIPDDFADYFFLQETGLTTAPMNTSIYAMINTKESKFNTVEIGDSIDVNDIVLNIQFTDGSKGMSKDLKCCSEPNVHKRKILSGQRKSK